MKVAPLLAEYLYAHRRLDLPGLGTFLLDPSVTIEQEHGKQNKASQLEGVSFESNPGIKESPELIQFISSRTGKIKALASADLESHLGLAMQFLNIGKPFLFEGIGSLSRIRSREYDFIPGQAILPTVKEVHAKEAPDRAEGSANDYKSVFYQKKAKANWKKPAAALLLVGGLVLAIWGGYTVYKRKSKDSNSPVKNDDGEAKKANPAETVIVEDTAKYFRKDSAAPVPPVTTPATVTPAGSYKFVLETSPAKRALARFSRLKTFQWNVHMETKDSLAFKIYMMLPAMPADTARLIDSLSRLNGKRVYIE